MPTTDAGHEVSKQNDFNPHHGVTFPSLLKTLYNKSGAEKNESEITAVLRKTHGRTFTFDFNNENHNSLR